MNDESRSPWGSIRRGGPEPLAIGLSVKVTSHRQGAQPSSGSEAAGSDAEKGHTPRPGGPAAAAAS